ncbi:MAG TPA: hypothetical protein VF796_25795, partial [Humisphaera sp.]
MFVFGIGIPVVAVLLEALFSACSGLIFDPLPTPWHALAAGAVPAANALVYLRAGRPGAGRSAPLRFANALAIGSALYFCVALGPLVPAGILGILAVGLGLLLLSPYFALIGALACRSRLNRFAAIEAAVAGGPAVSSPPRWRRAAVFLAGAGIPLAAMGVPEARRAWTMRQLVVATRGDDLAARSDAVAALRRWGDEGTMLDACDGLSARQGFVSGWRWMTDVRGIDPGRAAGAYYRATGRAPEERPFARNWRSRDRWADRREWDAANEDSLRGGIAVGNPVEGLVLNASAVTGTVHADAATLYAEWVIEFRNDTAAPQEARCRLRLPDGGVVSRVTLWIDGEEREAAYGPAGRVREAYQSVAVVQRRDPVLVTGCGPGRVMLQCFPVPARGTMKAKVGISAPLQLNAAADRGIVVLPSLLERNFSLPSGGRQ